MDTLGDAAIANRELRLQQDLSGRYGRALPEGAREDNAGEPALLVKIHIDCRERGPRTARLWQAAVADHADVIRHLSSMRSEGAECPQCNQIIVREDGVKLDARLDHALNAPPPTFARVPVAATVVKSWV